KKNGIMMIDFAIEARRAHGKSAQDAIFEACIVRFRPIMMTTMAALMGTLPIAMGFGAGAESRRPLGLAVVGGLLFSQMLALSLTTSIVPAARSFRTEAISRAWSGTWPLFSGPRCRTLPPEKFTRIGAWVLLRIVFMASSLRPGGQAPSCPLWAPTASASSSL